MMNQPEISIIIPVFQEGRLLLETLDTIDALAQRRLAEVIVVEGGREEAQDKMRMDWLADRAVRAVTAPCGRAVQMNAGARMAKGKILLFLHADTRLPKDALVLIRTVLSRTRASAGAFDLGIDSPRPAFRLIEQMVYWRSRITRIPYGDQAFFIRARAFRALGGYPPWPLMEDIALMQRIKKKGWPVVMVNRKILTSARRWEKEGVIRCTLRNWLLAGAFYLGVAAKRLDRFY